MRIDETIKKSALCMTFALVAGYLFTACDNEDEIPVDTDIPGVLENQPPQIP